MAGGLETKIAIKVGEFGCLSMMAFGLILYWAFFFAPADLANNAEATETSLTADATTAVLSTSVINQIKANKPTYINAANKEGVAWQALAAIHYREGSADPKRSGPSGEAPGEVNPDSHKVECNNFEECEVARAVHLKAMAKSVYGVKLNSTTGGASLRNAFLAYNRGFMYKRGGCSETQSPYVWNQFDAAHKNMTWPNSSCEPASTRGKRNIPYGAYTVYSYLVNNNI